MRKEGKKEESMMKRMIVLVTRPGSTHKQFLFYCNSREVLNKKGDERRAEVGAPRVSISFSQSLRAVGTAADSANSINTAHKKFAFHNKKPKIIVGDFSTAGHRLVYRVSVTNRWD